MRTCRIVILNYKTAGLAVDCLRSLEPELRAEPGCHVVVADNASPDDSVAVLQKAVADNGWQAWATVVPLPKNGGFSVGNNAGIRPVLESMPEVRYVHLLNPDTVIFPGAVTKLLDFMEANPKVGIAGSRLQYPDGSLQCAAFRFHGVLSEFERGVRLGFVSKLLKHKMVAPPADGPTRPAEWVGGASMMVRREVFEQIGLFDEEYFLYFEETDFQMRATRAGWQIWTVSESQVMHFEGASTGVTGADRNRRPMPRYWFESRRRYFRKNHGRLYEFLANLAYATGYGSWRVRRIIQGKPDPDPPGLWGDFVKFNFS